MKVPSKPSTISAEPWLGPKVTATLLRKNTSLLSSPSRRRDITWSGRPFMIADPAQYSKWCRVCQIHSDFIHQLPELLHLIVASWPFEAWGISVIGPISPPSVKGDRFILITNCFSKWAEVIPLAEVKTTNVINFIKHHVIYWFGVFQRIIHDNGPQFTSQLFYQFYN